MFERASKKLGLDHALLTQIDDTDSNSPNSLTSNEIDSLLKMGAYSLFQDDDSKTNAFCESTIEEILASRTGMYCTFQSG